MPPIPPELGEPQDGSTARLWSALESSRPPRPAAPDDDAAWVELAQRLDRPTTDRRGRRQDRRALAPSRHTRRFMRWAVLATFGLAALSLWAWQRPVVVMAEAGEQIDVTLPDGSEVRLNSGSALRYARGFAAWPFVPDGEREVRLEGEAFFEVVHGERPFVVQTLDARVVVLGTAFGVRAYQDSEAETGGTRVTVASGRVRVAAVGGEAVVLDAPGASTQIPATSDTSLQVETLSLPQAFAWRDQGFAAIDEPFLVVLAEVERRFAVEVTVEGSIPADALTIFHPRGATAEQILHDVCLARGCQFWRTSQGFGLRMTPSEDV